MPETNGSHAAMFREIEIRNFRGISELKLSFVGPDNQPSRIAVVGGPNGCGKTTVLEACLLAAGRADLLRGGYGRGAVLSGADDYRIRALFQVGSRTQVVECTASNGRPIFKAECGYFSSWRAPRLVGAVSVTVGKKGKRPQATEENRLWIVKQYLVNAKAHLSMMTTQPLMPGLSEYEAVLDAVNEIWETFYPNRGESFSVEPVSNDPDEGFDVFLNSARGSRVPLDALSSGQMEIFILAGSALPHRQKESILCIDEPELHLDPQWHRLILRAILRLRSECQVIVGTHSPEIYDSVMSFERHFLVSDDDPRAKAWEAATAKAGGAPA
jgi:ABC-type ATPase with predicted acetyltransferase domain